MVGSSDDDASLDDLLSLFSDQPDEESRKRVVRAMSDPKHPYSYFLRQQDDQDDDESIAEDLPSQTQQQRQRLLIALAHLSESQRTVIKLRFLEELSLDEIAASMERSVDVVAQLLIRATRELKESLTKDPANYMQIHSNEVESFTKEELHMLAAAVFNSK